MTSKEHYDAIATQLQLIEKDAIYVPDIPIAVYLQEAEDLYHVAKSDAAQLAKAGITEETTEDLNIRVGAGRYTQSLWNNEQNERQEAAKEWKEKSREAFNLRDELVHTFYFAFRKDEDLTSQVRAIDEGSSNADMIQDLSDLSVIGKNHLDVLVPLGVDEARLNKAANTADEMADLLARANGDRFSQNENKLNRDKAFTYLKELIDEVRDAGKYVFWKDEEKLSRYISKYLRKKRLRLERKKDKQIIS